MRKSKVDHEQRNGRARGVLCRRGGIVSEPQCGDGLVDTEVGRPMVVTNWGKCYCQASRGTKVEVWI